MKLRRRSRPVGAWFAALLLAACGASPPAGPARFEAGETCRAVAVTGPAGKPVVGIEDLAIDRALGLAYLSAYDRRAVAKERETGKGPRTTGGIYLLDLSEPIDSTVSVQRLAGPQSAPAIARPHGIALDSQNRGKRLAVIDRRYTRAEGEWRLAPHVAVLRLSKSGRRIEGGNLRPLPETLCGPNDLIFAGTDLLITNDRGRCRGLAKIWDDVTGRPGGALVRLSDTGAETAVAQVPFANGVARLPDGPRDKRLALAATRAGGVFFFASRPRAQPARKASGFADLSAAPDNITRGPEGTLYVAAHPNLIAYALFRAGLFGITRAPSAVYTLRLDAAGRAHAQKLLTDPAGTVISGATVAARYGDRLLLGAAYDDGLAVCSLSERDQEARGPVGKEAR